MKKYWFISFILLGALLVAGCSAVSYNFTGTGKINAKTVQVNYFQNMAPLVQPGIERNFTLKLQDILQSQTNLTLVPRDGDLLYEGEIVDYRVAPMTATANQAAAQNRLSVTVNVRYKNRNSEADNFEKKFSFYYDYDGAQQLVGTQLTDALDVIFERITQDIFNGSLAKW
ncbi:MAG: hypothetical protein CFE24_00955 [Flavobacterium sp. BFFFF2]|nr:MAG: hypothetical protein CFE24_00955 [Flavobacterium sp. BFFFF2]